MKKQLEIVNLHDKIKANYTTKYLTATIELANKEITLALLNEFGFICSFLGYTDDIHNFKNCLFFLFNPSVNKLNEWYRFYKLYSIERSFVYEYDLATGVILILFRIPEKYWSYPNLLLKGKYSKMNEAYAKKFIVNNNSLKQQTLSQYNVIMQTEEMRKKLTEELGFEVTKEIEYDSIPTREDEILSLKDLNL